MKVKKINRLIARILIISLIISNRGMLNAASKIIANDIDDYYASEYEHSKLDKIAPIIDSSDSLFGGSGGSDTSGNNKFISSTFEFSSPVKSGVEAKGYFYYSDDFFKNSSTTYDNHLSTTSIELAASGVANNMGNEKDKYGNLKDFMSKMGFRNIIPNEDYLKKPEYDSMGSVCANKPIYIKNGSSGVEKYNLIVIAMRSGNYYGEWVSNFKVGETGDHQGFSESRDVVYNHFTSFYNEHKDDFGIGLPVKIWVVGYSRGAAVANMLSGKLTDEAASFNTRKEDIYCYTIGTPKPVLKADHLTPSLESYTNIHNIISPVDLVPQLPPENIGFGRYGVDYELPYLRSEKVHNGAEKNARKAHNREYLNKYNKMLEYYSIMAPTEDLVINNFHVNELILATPTLQFMQLTDLSIQEFTDDKSEMNYYQAYEFTNAFVNDLIGDEILNCEYPGADYAAIKGRERLYTKYQELIKWAAMKFMGGEDFNTMINKIIENAKSNILSLVSVLTAIFALVYTDGAPQDRTHYVYPYDPAYPPSPSEYKNVYDVLQPIYETLLQDAVSTEDYNFLMSKHRDITDLLIDLLNTDYRTTHLATRSAIGSIYKNTRVWLDVHKTDTYISWLMSLDSYYKTPPVDTIYIYGNKIVTFTNLNNSVVKIYDDKGIYVGEYTIDSDGNVDFTSGLGEGYINIVKSYNPEGLELRVPSSIDCKAEIISTNSSIGNVLYREYFIDDASYYRKVKDFGTVNLNENEHYVIEFRESRIQSVLSCYRYDLADDSKRKRMNVATINEVLCVYGNDEYYYLGDTVAYKMNAITTVPLVNPATASMIEQDFGTPNNVASNSEITEADAEGIATNSEINIDESENIATFSEVNIDDSENIATISDINTDDSENIEIDLDEDNDFEEDIATESDLDGEEVLQVEMDEMSDVEEEASEIENFEMETSGELEQIEESVVNEESEVSEELEASEESELNEELELSEGYIVNEESEPSEEIETETDIESEKETEVLVNGFTGTDGLLTENNKVTVKFDGAGAASLYYYNGRKYVITESGNSFDIGTKIKIVAPRRIDTNVFYGWTLMENESKELLNRGGIDTPRIDDVSNADESAYILELKDYSLDIVANYMDNGTPEDDPEDDPGDKGGGSEDSGGSGGSGGGGGIIPSIQEQIDKLNPMSNLNINEFKIISDSFNSQTVSWRYDPIGNKWKLTGINNLGQDVYAINGFYEITSYKTMYINGMPSQSEIKDTYYFDKDGNMVTGFVNTINNMRYYFETAKTLDEGKMVIGWKDINGFWYYFGNDVAMFINTMTPDGYFVNVEGKWVQ